jgi:hypothetical protein
MLKKIILSVLLVTVITAAGIALVYNIITREPDSASAAPDSVANDVENVVGQPDGLGGEPLMVAQGTEGDPWQESGTITEIDDYGFQFALQDGETVYIELGPPAYWQNQGVELKVDQTATVSGSINEGVIHSSQVILADGQILDTRSEAGQPLWSGGVTNGNGQSGNNRDGDRVPESQAQVEEWVTIEGTLMSFQGGNMTMKTSEGELLSFQTGQPRFFAQQNVTFHVGDEIIVVGFFDSDQFTAGGITQVSTGLRVMLRDPNGRPLWAGPGGNGNSNRGSQGRQGFASSTP